MRRVGWVFSSVIGAALLLAGCRCGRSKQAEPAASSSATPVTASAEPKAAEARPLELFKLTGGQASFVMDGKLETTRGSVSGVQGDVQFDFSDFTRTSGMIALDLSTLKTQTFDDVDKDAEQTIDALTWLELHARSAPKELRDRHQLAVFTIRQVDKVHPPTLAAAGGPEPTVVATVTGDLRLHGVSVRQTLEIEATFQLTANKVTSVRLKTDEPFEVHLPRHAIQPRDKNGAILTKPSKALKDKIAERVLITLELTAESTGKPAEP